MKMQKQLLLESSLSLPSKRELVIDAVAGDDDVQFLWVLHVILLMNKIPFVC